MGTLFEDLGLPTPHSDSRTPWGSSRRSRAGEVDASGVPTWATTGGEAPTGGAARQTPADPEALLAGLIPQQRAAVAHDGPPLLIVAGAG